MSDPQSLAGKQGRTGEELAEMLAIDTGFEIMGRHIRIGGVEADLLIRSRIDADIFVSVKWSMRGKRPGLVRTDTLKKAIAEAWAIKRATNRQPFIVMTSHIPTRGCGKELLDAALEDGLFDMVVVIGSPDAYGQLESLHER